MMNKHLMKKVEEEIARRQKSEKHLETQKKFADMGQMINAIAHQWRQPLNGLGLYIQDMAENIREDKFTEEDVDEFENASMTLINNMSRTIDDFRSYFLPQNEKAVFNVAFDMIALMKLLSAQLSSKDINFTISCSCDDEMEECANLKDFPECLHEHADIFGYSGEFKQAMMNIITNAIDAIDERKNDINSEKGMIKVIITCYNKKIKVTIKDNGRGIPEENLSKIYDPYFTTKPQGSGTGIGLYVTRLLIEKHMGGRINTYNNPEGGTGVDIIFSQGK
jgi:signal transduction histidine kinase